MRRRQALRRLGAGAVVAVAGCVGGDGPTRVRMAGVAFDPDRVTVPVGGTVEWVNEGRLDHTVTAYEDRLPAGAAYFASGGFASEAATREDLADGFVAPGETYAHTFETAGDHPYYCIPHEASGMTGVVVVG